MTWILDKFKSWNFHGICWENDGIPIGFRLIFDQTAVKRHETIHVTFFTALTLILLIFFKKKAEKQFKKIGKLEIMREISKRQNYRDT